MLRTVKDERKRVAEALTEQQEKYGDEVEAIRAAFSADNALSAPAKLWEDKRAHHEGMAEKAYEGFCGALIAIALFVLLVFALFAWAAIADALLPVGCDVGDLTDRCDGFSLKAVVAMTTLLTLLNVTLWFTRLKMEEFLAERHLALDARERHAFAQAYIGFLKEGDTSDEAKEQRAIVYSALFRPTSDGIVKEDGGLDPSISSALTKFL